jgi:glycosyltransferase involved in cell wall biosynthesis
MSGWENVQRINRYILPFEFGIIGKVIDIFAKLPLLNNFALNTMFIARKTAESNPNKEHSVTVLVPCKDEEGNIEGIVKRIPDFGEGVEILFINDKGTDNTEEKILDCQKKYSSRNIKLIQGRGGGKSKAVRVGMEHATGDICMILDADLAVIPEDLPQFYYALNYRRADFLHGTRMVYPQEDDAMRPANLLGNIFFSGLFSYILDQRITDTLCGTKVFWRRDWHIFEEMREILKNADMWGDYNLIFGAARFGLKIGELPVRYFQRLKGLTKVTQRIRNGLTLLRMTWYALWEIKYLS